MKGLLAIPNTADLAAAYREILSAGAADGPAISCSSLARWSQFARFDPRLAEILVEYLSRAWKSIPSGRLNDELRKEPWPAAIGVLVEEAADESADPGAFRAWSRSVLEGISPASGGEQYFIGLRRIGGTAMLADAARAHLHYAKWGYLGREILLNKAAAKELGARTRLDGKTRKRLLDQLIAERASFDVRTYLQALDFSVGLRQAQKDLASHPRLRAVGRTRGLRYVRVKR